MTDPSQTTTDNSWSAHLRGTLRIGMPLIAAQMAHQAITVIDTIMLGWLSTEALAASVLGTTAFFIALITANGFGYAVVPLAAAASGQGDIRAARRSVRMGFWVVLVVAAVLMPVLWNAQVIFLASGQDPELSEMATGYLRIAQWSMFPAAMVVVLRSFLSAVERTSVIMWATLFGVAVNAIGNWVLIFGNYGAPAMGLRGAALASVIAHVLTLVPIAIYVARDRELAVYRIFTRFWRADWPGFFEVFRLGFPISGTMLAEVGLFAGSSFMMGWLGTIALAAHGIALQIISVIFMIPLGLATAATSRVGRALGRRDMLGIDRAARTVMGLGLSVATLGALILWFVPEMLVGLFLGAEDVNRDAVIATGAVLLAVAAVFQIVDTLQVISLSLLRGLKDTRVPMLQAVVSYWLIGIPIAYYLGFKADMGGAGIWAGLAAGLACAAILLTWRFLRRSRLGLTAAD